MLNSTLYSAKLKANQNKDGSTTANNDIHIQRKNSINNFIVYKETNYNPIRELNRNNNTKVNTTKTYNQTKTKNFSINAPYNQNQKVIDKDDLLFLNVFLDDITTNNHFL